MNAHKCVWHHLAYNTQLAPHSLRIHSAKHLRHGVHAGNRSQFRRGTSEVAAYHRPGGNST
eukprot:2701077-Pyramimonas_sp.AAC.1